MKNNSIKSIKAFSFLAIFITLFLSFLPTSSPTKAYSNKIKKVENPIPNSYIVVLNEEIIETKSNTNTVNTQARVAQQVDAIAEEIAQTHSAKVTHTYKDTIKGFSIKLKPEQLESLSNDPRIKYIEEDGMVFASET